MMWSYKAIIVLKTVKFCQSFVDCKLCQNKTISEICKWLILRNHNPWIHKSYYLNTGHKFNIHKMFRRRPISIPLKKPENFFCLIFSWGIKMERLLEVLVRSICILYPGSTVLQNSLTLEFQKIDDSFTVVKSILCPFIILEVSLLNFRGVFRSLSNI